MANTFSSLFYHIIFTTKGRARWLTPDIEQEVWRYLGGIAREEGMKLLMAGGIEDHVHLLISIPPATAVSNAVGLIKGNSSRWLSKRDKKFAGFAWQDGYGVFSVSYSGIGEVTKYIANQRERHAGRTFEDEYRAFLSRHDLVFDERYVWG
jgi:REP element-mobilizing transposase RayT